MNKNPQLWPHEKFSQYSTFDQCAVLEIGGNQNCESAAPFLNDGANRVVVSGLKHVLEGQTEQLQGIQLSHTNAFDITKEFGKDSFDFIYGISIIEHIPRTEELLEEMYQALRPGGMLYLQGGPIWSAPRGHHIWISKWEDRSTQNYFFNDYPGTKSVNPIPDWGHLLLSQQEMQDHLESKNIPTEDIEKILDWIYSRSNINRLDFSYLASAVSGSSFTVLEANMQFMRPVPKAIAVELRNRYGPNQHYGVGGLEYVLIK